MRLQRFFIDQNNNLKEEFMDKMITNYVTNGISYLALNKH